MVKTKSTKKTSGMRFGNSRQADNIVMCSDMSAIMTIRAQSARYRRIHSDQKVKSCATNHTQIIQPVLHWHRLEHIFSEELNTLIKWHGYT